MVLARYFFSVLAGGLLLAGELAAQGSTGTITGRVVDGSSQLALSDVNVVVVGTQRGTLTRDDGTFLLSSVPVGTHTLRATRIGYAPQEQQVTVTTGAPATVDFSLAARAIALAEVVVTGYGTQRREAITGSVVTIDADAADVGVITNVNEMIQGRVAGVQMTTNNGEPGAGAQIRIRGGTSISASNDPLYVIDGVPINNVETEARGIGIGGDAALPRSPLNLLNPSDIESITILKDASATAIYGSRAANGVILIETKDGGSGDGSVMEYDGYVAMATPYRYLDVLDGAQYRQFVEDQVAAGNLDASRLDELGTANTNWERELTEPGVTQNHNVSFAGGTEATRYRASANYLDQQGVALSSGLERIQGRLNGRHTALGNRLRLGLNLTASHLKNDYLAYETSGGFEGGVFQNVAIFNPTRPVTEVNDITGAIEFFETGSGRQSVRNPVALAHQIADFGTTTRALGNASAELDLLPGLTGQVIVGADRSDGLRRTYFPRSSPVGAEWNGRAVQSERDVTTKTLQTLLTYRQEAADVHNFDILGGYEFNEYSLGEFRAEAQDFISDATGFHNLSAGSRLIRPGSFREESRLVSFFTRANYGYRDRYYLTGVLRYDGSSRFGAGNKWAAFPAVSASWRVSEEEFMRGDRISELRLRAGLGLQGNPAVPPYSSLIRLETPAGAQYVFGNTPVVGVAPVSNPNPNLKWEETRQFNVALDYGLFDNRFSGTLEYYVKTTSDLLLEVSVPQPALAATRLENIGQIKNRGLEFSLDALALSRTNLTWQAGLVFAVERNEVVDLGGRSFITTGGVSGQGQSGQVSQRIIPGEPLGTFFGPRFVGVDGSGKQLFQCARADADCVGGTTTSPRSDDFGIIGDANPDFTLGLRSQVNWGQFDASFLVNSAVGQDVFNNTALVYATKGNVLQDKNFLASALDDGIGINEPAIFSSRWVEDGSFVRLQNLTVGYTLDVPGFIGQGRTARVYMSGDNLLLLTGYDGPDPEVHAGIQGLAVRGIDYLSYPRPRTFTAGVHVSY
ncbi:MAG: SusC/RagA family TonB-linked outer membrane protein [Gemmatimonadaceae bacterium]